MTTPEQARKLADEVQQEIEAAMSGDVPPEQLQGFNLRKDVLPLAQACRDMAAEVERLKAERRREAEVVEASEGVLMLQVETLESENAKLLSALTSRNAELSEAEREIERLKACDTAEYDGAQAARRGASIGDCPYGPNKPDGFRDSTLMGMWQKGHDLVTRAKEVERLRGVVRAERNNAFDDHYYSTLGPAEKKKYIATYDAETERLIHGGDSGK